MKLIHKYKSPNFNKRKRNIILFIIIHYTALKNYKEAITYLCDSKNKVSAHYVISQEGKIFNLVDVKKRAWHAGLSYWDGCRDINSVSIGIELDFSYKNKNNHYTKDMIVSLIILLKKLKKKYNINNENILGHADIAPFRKKDPGEKFPWYHLQNENIAFDANQQNLYKTNIIKNWFYKNKINSNKKIALFILAIIGYDTLGTKLNNYLYSKLILVYQNHFMQSNRTGKVDNKTLNFMINHFLNILLTKIKKNIKTRLMVR